MLLMTMLTSVGAWAQADMLKTDTEEPLGSAARHYVLMPVNANQEFVIPTDGSGRPVDGNGNLLRSFKLYDDGGKGGSSNWSNDLNYPGNYNPNNSCGIQIIAPEGYRLHINGVAHLVKVFSVSHRGEYRDDYKNVATEEEKFTTWYGTHSFNESSTGKSVTFWLTAYPAGGSNYSDNGFDLTITVFKDNETYNVDTSSVPHGTVTTNKATATFMEQVNMTITPDAYYESTSTHSYIGNDNTSVNVSSSPHFFMMPNSDVTFPNMFKPIDYTITYTNDDGTSAADGQNGMTNANPTTYNVETPNITLVAPKRFGYTFAGWYNNAGCTGDAITGAALPVGSHGNQTFYAKWTQNSGSTETITSETGEVTINDNITVTGTSGENTHLKIADGATVTIKNLTITVPNDESKNWPGIECLGDATIILDGTNNITVNDTYPSGIFVPSGKTLTIQEASTGGTLTINSHGPGIGSNDTSLAKDNCGNIIINGGTFNIVSTSSVAIGASNYRSCGNITINGGTITVQGVAGIGSSRYGSSCGNITIANTVNSVTVTGGIRGNSVTIGGVSTGNISFSPYVYNPSAAPVTITFDKGAGTGTMEAQTYYSGIPQNLNLSTFTAPDDHFFYNWSTQPDGGGETYIDGQLFLPTADMTLYAQYTPTTMTLTSSTGSVRLLNGMTLTGTGGKNTSVSIADGATVTFNNVTIPNVSSYSDRYYAVQCEGDATIFFEGTNEVDNSSRDNYPALFVPENKTLTIIGTGSLTAKGGQYAPGIGSGINNGGHIVIISGTVTATGGDYCAGIGSSNYPCGDITIANTVTCVTATAGSGAPNAIGSTNHWTNSSCGTIYIGYLLYDETSGSTHTLRPQIAVSLADNADNTDALDNAHNKFSMVTLNGRTIYRDGDWNTLTLPFPMTAEQIAASPLAGATIKTLDATNSNLASDGKLTLSFTTATEIEAGKPYIVKWTPATPNLTISTATEWDAFATAVNGGTTYEGQIVKLAADISVTTMVGTGGSSGKRFKGTFDGAGHTLTVTYNVDETYDAPFRAVEGATIKNLHVVGTITTSHTLAAGLISEAYGNCTISKCRSSVIITSSRSGEGSHGGFIGQARSGSSITINNCLFDGQLLGSSTSGCGGFVGFRESNGSLTFTNCLFDPSAEITISTNYSYTFARYGSTNTSFENCYYKTAFGTAQGKQTNATGDALVAQLGDGWENNSGNVVPKMDADIINNPVFRGVTVDKTAPTAVSFTNNASTGYCQFVGNYSPFTIDDSNINSIILLGSNNKLGYSASSRTLRAFRAHFYVPSKPDGSAARSFVINFGDEETTAVFDLNNKEERIKNNGWYTLGGLKLQGEPTEKGIYIYNGKKVVK